MSPASALVLERPGDRLRPLAWCGLVSLLAAITLTAVSIPVLSAVYGVFVPLSFLVAGAHGAALAATPHRPREAIAVSSLAVFVVGLLTAGGTGLPWPLPVVTMITQVFVCALVALRGDVRTMGLALLASGAAASAPALLALTDTALWSAAGTNLLTFGSVTVLVTACGLALSSVIPWASAPANAGERR